MGVDHYSSNELMAEKKGFEPSIPFPVYSLSRGAPSTTRPPLRCRLTMATNVGMQGLFGEILKILSLSAAEVLSSENSSGSGSVRQKNGTIQRGTIESAMVPRSRKSSRPPTPEQITAPPGEERDCRLEIATADRTAVCRRTKIEIKRASFESLIWTLKATINTQG